MWQWLRAGEQGRSQRHRRVHPHGAADHPPRREEEERPRRARMRTERRITMMAAAVVAAVLLSGGAAQTKDEEGPKLPPGPIADRHELMEHNGDDAKKIGDALKAGEPGDAGARAER